MRRMIQIVSLVAVNSYFFSFLKTFPFPVLNCYACPLASFACPVGTIQFFLSVGTVPLFTVGILGITGLLWGRGPCGWNCPFGLFQELLHRVPTKKFRMLPWLGYSRYICLAVLVVVLPLVVKETWFCKLCPQGGIEAGIPIPILDPDIRGMIGPLFRVKMMLVVFWVAMSILVFRAFCTLFCPLGAILGLFNRMSLFRPVAKRCPLKVCSGPESLDCFRCYECVRRRKTTHGGTDGKPD